MLIPGLGFLLAFFVAPLYYVFLFSVGERYLAATKAAASVTGELTSFSWQRWSDLLGAQARVDVLGLRTSTAVWVLCAIEVVLLTASVVGGRMPRAGGWVVGGSLALLLLP